MEQSLEDPLRDSFSWAAKELSELVITKVTFYPLYKLAQEACSEELSLETLNNSRKEFKKKIFEIEVKMVARSWMLRKRVEDFTELGKYLKDKYKKKIPHLPVRKESEAQNFDMLMDFYVIFLTTACKIEEAQEDVELLTFLQIPVIRSRRRLKTYLQMDSRKRSGGRYNEASCRGCVNVFTNWKKRFFTVSSEGIFYSSGHTKQDSTIKEMLLFSYDFIITYGLSDTGHKWGINLNSCQRMLHIKTSCWYEFSLFILAVKMALKQNGYLEKKRFESFAPVREDCEARYYIDGQNYFKAVHDEISSAKTEVFITGWMLTPFYLLCRPNSLESDYRLDKLLERIAKRGVKVYIIIFLEPKLALNNDSEYTKQYLQSLHPNIKVLRHPPFLLIPFLWSHHQKIVVVDQRIGFIGGLDICYGRFDNNQHRLSDPDDKNRYWEGADYCNLRISDVYTPRQYENSLINRNIDPRLPWHDVTVQLRGDSVIDLSRHFIQYWNFVNFQTQFNQRELLIQVGIVPPEEEEDRELMDMGGEAKDKTDEVRDKLRKDIRRLEVNRVEEQHFLQEESMAQALKMRPKRSASEVIDLESTSRKFKLEREMSERYELHANFQHFQNILVGNQKEKVFYRNHLEKEEEKNREEKGKKTFEQFVERKFEKLKKDLQPLNPFKDDQPSDPDIVLAGTKTSTIGNMRHQILRSSSKWSLGLKDDASERSIYNSFISLIANSEEYIYIESQFFICVENHIADAIQERVALAAKNKQKFKVIVIVPLLPAFEGEIDSSSSTILKVQLHWQYQTVCRGGHSLLQKLSNIENLDEYIQFYCLRTHGIIGTRPVSEIIYVHSKLMIIDDQVVLIGSANINDRSLLGTRDSEIGIMIEDKEEVEVLRNGEKIKVKKFPYEMRVDLFMEHFGLTKEEACRLMHDDDIWWLVKERANKNTAMYREVFAVYPDDAVKSLSDLQPFQKSRDLRKYQIFKDLITGNVVEFPREFLKFENLKPKPNQKEYYIPEISFT